VYTAQPNDEHLIPFPHAKYILEVNAGSGIIEGDEFDIDEDGVCNLMQRISRYTKNFDEHLFKMEDVRKSIEKSTGIVLKGWG
jgi:hypothetical protein